MSTGETVVPKNVTRNVSYNGKFLQTCGAAFCIKIVYLKVAKSVKTCIYYCEPMRTKSCTFKAHLICAVSAYNSLLIYQSIQIILLQ